MRRRVIEADDATDDRARESPSAKPEDLVSIAHELPGGVEEPRSHRARLTAQLMSLAVGHQGQASRAQEVRFCALDIEPALTGGDDVKHHRGFKRGQV